MHLATAVGVLVGSVLGIGNQAISSISLDGNNDGVSSGAILSATDAGPPAIVAVTLVVAVALFDIVALVADCTEIILELAAILVPVIL